MMMRSQATAAAGAMALGAAACLASPGALAQANGVTLGGTLDIGLREVRNGSLGLMRSQVSGANSTSKLVIRGTEDLGGGMVAGFYLDGTFNPTNGTAGAGAPAFQFWDRRSTVQLQHRSFGEVRLGRDWVPTHLVWTNFDPFTTLGIASANSFRSFAASRALGQAFGTAAESVNANPTLRVNSALEYFLPGGLGGVYGQLVKTGAAGLATGAGGTSGDGWRLGWSGAGVNVSAGQFTTRNAGSAGNRRFVDQAYGVSYEFDQSLAVLGGARVSLAQRRWTIGADRTVNTLAGVMVPVGGVGMIKVSVLKADQTGATAAQSANDATLLGAGYVHSLSKRTALYAHVARIANDGAATFAIPGGPAVSGVSTAANFFGGQVSRGYEFGVRHDF